MAHHSSNYAAPSEVDPGTPRMPRALRGAFYDRFDGSLQGDGQDAIVARAPGRVNLMGDHTDYNDGLVLPTTIDRAVYAVLRPRSDANVRLRSLNFGDSVAYALADPPIDKLPGWARYVAGVTEELRRRKGISTGFEGIVYGNVPLGSGLSSSAALEVAAALALDAMFSMDLDPVQTAQLCQAVEHEYVGVNCGIMDQMAARLGRAAHALWLDCRSLEYEHVPLAMDDTSLVIADSGVTRELATSQYNERRAECEEAVDHFHECTDGRVRALRDVTRDLLTQHGDDLRTPVLKRSRHVLAENQRVRDGTEHLRRGALEAFGALMNASHASLRDNFEASSPELNALVDEAQSTDGVLGARMTGAGFGGCIVCLAQNVAVPTLKRRLVDRYVDAFDREPTVYVVRENLESGLL